MVEDNFTTISGRKVALEDLRRSPAGEARADYAMGALKRAMRWDEEAFGREYDLDVFFMIVAVSHFNMGAMENKGLNIFNDKNVLASQETATDQDFNSVEAIIAHEYRLQLDRRPDHLPRLVPAQPQGRADGISRSGIHRRHALAAGVKRIADVRALRGHDSSSRMPGRSLTRCGRRSIARSATSTPSTIYEKGAEVVRMLKTLLGPESAFRAGMDLYFRAP